MLANIQMHMVKFYFIFIYFLVWVICRLMKHFLHSCQGSTKFFSLSLRHQKSFRPFFSEKSRRLQNANAHGYTISIQYMVIPTWILHSVTSTLSIPNMPHSLTQSSASAWRKCGQSAIDMTVSAQRLMGCSVRARNTKKYRQWSLAREVSERRSRVPQRHSESLV